jgi:alkanesulfonate monooxygenase SsuD/methylene tetrahydromethanopterin reductase-like flavin-dependent oxidoreductase (luciferase family)
MMMHKDEATAIERGIDGAHFFGYSLAHYYVFGEHRPGITNIWEEFQERRAEFGFAREIIHPDDGPLGVKILEQGFGSLRGAIGTPAQVVELVQRYERAGVDQVIFVQQAGPNKHEHICESLELFGDKVLPHFAEGREDRETAKRERLAGAVEAALARRPPPRSPDPGYVITPQGEPRSAQLMAAAHRATANGAGRRHWLRERVQRAGESALGAFVRGRSDAQLERTVGSKTGLRVIFKGMEHAFVPEKANGFSGEVQYELTGRNGDRNWVVRIEDGQRAVTAPGRAESPGVTFRTSVPMFARIASGEVHPAKAMMEGDLEVQGDFELAARLGEMFGQDSLL